MAGCAIATCHLTVHITCNSPSWCNCTTTLTTITIHSTMTQQLLLLPAAQLQHTRMWTCITACISTRQSDGHSHWYKLQNSITICVL